MHRHNHSGYPQYEHNLKWRDNSTMPFAIMLNIYLGSKKGRKINSAMGFYESLEGINLQQVAYEVQMENLNMEK
jgi:hypothetical protein